MQIFLAICGSGIFAALSAIFAPILLERYRYKNNKITQKDETIKKIDDLQKTTDERLSEINSLLEKQGEVVKQLSTTVDALVSNEIARTYIDIRRKSLAAIKKGEIKDSQRKRILEDYDRYEQLPSANGYLKDTINAVKDLRLIIDDDDINDF